MIMELHVLVGKLHEKNRSVFRGLRLWKNPWDIFVAFCRPFFSLLNNECFLTLAARLEKLTSIETEYQICHWQGLWLSNRKIINSSPCRYHFFSKNSPRQKWKDNICCPLQVQSFLLQAFFHQLESGAVVVGLFLTLVTSVIV